MNVSEYIVEYLIHLGVTDVFGYPGGMVAPLMDAFSKRSDRINQHVCFHEQAGAFEACGYAQSSGRIGVAFSSSGPGATNLITGICDAWFDSIPVLFITGQVNTNEMRDDRHIRQRGFQETDIVPMVVGVTKFATTVMCAEDICGALDDAYFAATTGRKGPVLIDVPLNILRAELNLTDSIYNDVDPCDNSIPDLGAEDAANKILHEIQRSKRPCVIAGCGIKYTNIASDFRELVSSIGVPVITTMPAFDLLPNDHPNRYGFIGAYGDRVANFIVAKSDLIISLGARLDVRQVGGIRENFAPDAHLMRIDIDKGELEYQVRSEETDIHADAALIISNLLKNLRTDTSAISILDKHKWIDVCNTIRDCLQGLDQQNATQIVRSIGAVLPDNITITTDVGQNQVWVAQALPIKKNQRVLFSAGLGSMGYSLPAAIGAYYGTGRPVIAFMGDGGLQMNLQELEFLQRDRIPVKVVVLNNYALGMIRHFQEMYYDSNYTDTVCGQGYAVPNLELLAGAYGLEYHRITDGNEAIDSIFKSTDPALIEVCIPENTYVYPKLRFKEPNQDQEPLIPRELYRYLMEL